jgi:phosphoglycolate phosphatase
MPTVILFDIDGTLVLTGGAGVRAMTRAGESVLGVEDLLKDVHVAGRTDWIILEDALARIGRDLDDDLLGRLRDAHVANLREEMRLPGQGAKAVMPGVRELLAALQPRPDVHLGLLTGNFEAAARIKLEYFALWGFFGFGAFGDDSPDRNALVPIALRRACASGLGELECRDVVVIGDTPHDIACAHAVGALPIGVATGHYTVGELRDAGAKVVLPDLSDTGALLRLLENPFAAVGQ